MRTFRTYYEVEDAGQEVPDQVGAQHARLARRLARIHSIWLVASGKGGVGKSAVTANLAAALAARGLAVGGLDGDVNGPSLARMLGAARGPLASSGDGVLPAAGAAGTRVMSMDLLLGSPDAPVRWREPDASAGFLWQSALETGAVREFLSDVAWGSLDVLLIDLPPGTDKLSRVLEMVPEPAGVLLVTTPSEAARAVVTRSATLLRGSRARDTGLVVNMAGHACTACGHVDALFDDGADRRLATDSGLDVWARVPFHSGFATATDGGRPPVLEPGDPASAALLGLADRIAATLGEDAP